MASFFFFFGDVLERLAVLDDLALVPRVEVVDDVEVGFDLGVDLGLELVLGFERLDFVLDAEVGNLLFGVEVLDLVPLLAGFLELEDLAVPDFPDTTRRIALGLRWPAESVVFVFRLSRIGEVSLVATRCPFCNLPTVFVKVLPLT